MFAKPNTPKNPLFFNSEDEMVEYFKRNPPPPPSVGGVSFLKSFVEEQLKDNKLQEEYIKYRKRATPVLDGPQKLEKPRFVGSVWKINQACGHSFCVGKNTREEREIMGTTIRFPIQGCAPSKNQENASIPLCGYSYAPCKDCKRWSKEPQELKLRISQFRDVFHAHNSHYPVNLKPMIDSKSRISTLTTEGLEYYTKVVEPKYYTWLYVDERSILSLQEFEVSHTMKSLTR